jgi:hypothetical protein
MLSELPRCRKSSTAIPPPRRPKQRIDIELPKLTKSKVESDPNIEWPSTENVPSMLPPLVETEPPMRAKLLTASEDPVLKKSVREKLPANPCPYTETMFPLCKNSPIDRTFPKTPFSWTLAESPTRVNARSDKELPRWRKSRTASALPVRPKLRNASELPRCTKSKTLIPEPHRP